MILLINRQNLFKIYYIIKILKYNVQYFYIKQIFNFKQKFNKISQFLQFLKIDSSSNTQSHNQTQSNIVSPSTLLLPNTQQSIPSGGSVTQQPSQLIQQLSQIILKSCVVDIKNSIERNIETVPIDLQLFPQYSIDTLLTHIPIALIQASMEIIKVEYEDLKAKQPQDIQIQKSQKLKPKYYDFKREINQIKDINSYHLNKLVRIQGILVDKSVQQIQLYKAAYQCLNCSNWTLFVLNQDQQQISTICDHCRKQALVLNSSMSEYTSFVSLTIQQQQTSPLPVVMRATCMSQDANQLRVGDNVDILAVVRISKQVSTYLQTISVDKITSSDRVQDKQIEKEVENFKINNIIPAEIQGLLPEDDNPNNDKYVDLVQSMAPTVYGDNYNLIKEVMLWQQCAQVQGSINQDKSQQIQQHQSQPIHICLMGPPGIAKSSLLLTTPNARYTSAKQATLPGLTAAVSQQGGQTILQQGLIPQSSNHILLLDEVEKMTPDIYNGLTAAMSRQKITIAKAGIFTELDANCSIFAAGNYGNEAFYNTKFYSLFDVVFRLVDKNDVESNANLARSILQNQQLGSQSKIDQIDLQRYISLAQQLTVGITDEAKQYLIELYKRHLQLEPEKWTAQNFSSIIKLAIARCKSRFGEQVTINDVKRVEYILQNCVQKQQEQQGTNQHILTQREINDKLIDLLDKTETGKMKIDEISQILQVNKLRLQTILDDMMLGGLIRVTQNEVEKM